MAMACRPGPFRPTVGQPCRSRAWLVAQSSAYARVGQSPRTDEGRPCVGVLKPASAISPLLHLICYLTYRLIRPDNRYRASGSGAAATGPIARSRRDKGVSNGRSEPVSTITTEDGTKIY